MHQTNTYSLSISQQSIVKTLLYYDLFGYPLREEELFENSSVKQIFNEFREDLTSLTGKNLINYEDGFYYNPTSTSEIIKKRIAGNSLAEIMLPKAFQFSKKIAGFPFITGICISG